MDTSRRNSRIPSNLKESEEPDTSNSVTLAYLPNELLTMILCYSEVSSTLCLCIDVHFSEATMGLAQYEKILAQLETRLSGH